MTEASSSKKYADFQQSIFHGRIAHMEVVNYQDQEFLSVSLMHTVSDTTDIRIKFTNSNGLLTAYRNGNVVVGQELTVNGTIKGIRSFYMKEEELVPLKNPELQLRCTGYIFGTKPEPKQEPVATTAGAEPTLEEIPF